MEGILMAHAAYFNKEGKRLPSVTTVIANLGWNKDALMKWSWAQGRDGFEFRENTVKAASIGTVAHAMVEAHVLGKPFEEDAMYSSLTAEQLEMSTIAFDAYLKWRQMTTLDLIKAETQCVSEKYQYGGTIDTIAVTPGDDKMVDVVDWKTSNSTYADHLIQVAAYAKLYEEAEGVPVSGVHLCRFAKDAPAFHHHYWPVQALEPAWITFTHLRALHHYRWIIQKLV